jgi:surface protein
MFGAAHSFNQDISNWNVSSVISMQRMFSEAKEFNQDISDWDVSSVINMEHMFYAAAKFNQPLNKWCVSNVEEQPEGFSRASIIETTNLPVWGKCPLIDDDDNDGVVNYYDSCPGTDEGLDVNEDGCAEDQIDENNNGVPDSLEGDSDSDGVIDFYDECSNTTTGALVDSKGCAVIDQVFLFSGAISTVVLNNNVSGTISFSIRNNLPNSIQLESLTVYDGDTGALKASSTKSTSPSLFPSLAPGQSHSLQATFNSFIYLPMYYWKFTYNGQTYEVSKSWSITSGQTRPYKEGDEPKPGVQDNKVIEFRLINKDK